MPIGYRYIVFAGLGWLALCAAKPPPEQRDAGKRTQQGKNSAVTVAVATPSPSLPVRHTNDFTAYSDYNSERCYKAHDHDTADLCAQWRAARAAEKAVHEARRATNWAIVGTLLSATTIIGLIITIWQTKGALGEARRSNRLNLLAEQRNRRKDRATEEESRKVFDQVHRHAEAAIKLADVSEGSAERRIEAYLVVEKVFISFVNGKCHIRLGINNCGQSPALQITYQINHTAKLLIGDIVNIEIDTTPTEPFDGPEHPISVIAANTRHLTSPEETLIRFIDGDAKAINFVIDLKVSYVTVFGKSKCELMKATGAYWTPKDMDRQQVSLDELELRIIDGAYADDNPKQSRTAKS